MKSRHAGFTLTELLVALALGGVLLAAVLAAAAVASRHHAEVEQAARLQERGNHVLGLLEPEVQLAGFGGLAPLSAWTWPAAVGAGATACGTLHLPAPAAVRIDTGYALACAPHGGGAVPASDVLTLLRAGARLASPAVGRLQALTARRTGTPPIVLENGALPSGHLLTPGRQELREVELQSFYVSRDSDGTPGLPALRLKALTAIDGRAAIVDQELVPGVEMLCVEFGTPDPAGLAYAHGTATFAPGRLPAVLRVSALVRSEKPWGRTREQAFDCAQRHVVRQDAFLRRYVTRTWALRNVTTEDAS